MAKKNHSIQIKKQSKLPRIVVKKLGREKAFGIAYFIDHEINIDPRQTQREYLDTMIHEAVHLADPSLSERKVNSMAKFVSKVLWKHGYRLMVMPR